MELNRLEHLQIWPILCHKYTKRKAVQASYTIINDTGSQKAVHKLTTQASGARVKGDGLSDIEEDRGLVGVLHLFDTEDRSVHLVVDPGQVSDGRSLTDTAELVVHGTVAQADPALVGTEVGHGDAAQVSADSGGADD